MIEFDRDRSRLSLLETAAYTMSRRQLEDRGYTANLEVGQVLAAAALSPEQHALFKPEVAQKMKEATDSVPRGVNPSFEVRQVKWSRQAQKVLGGHVFRARQWLDANPHWHPAFVYGAPKPIAPEVSDEVGGGNTPKAKAYIWRTSGKQDDAVPPCRATLPAKAIITRADGSPYVFSDSSGDEIDPATGKVVRMPSKLLSPFMAVGSVIPVTRRESQKVKREAGRTSYRAAILAFGAARTAEGLRRREAFFTAVARAEAAAAEAAASKHQADPLGLAVAPVDRDPLDLAKWGSQSLGTTGPQLCLRPRKKRSVPPANLKARETERQRKRGASTTRQRGASGSRPVALVPNAAYERRREIMKNMAGGLPAVSLIPAVKGNLGSGGRNNPETAATEFVGEIPFQHVPVPTAFTERYLEVEKAADKSGLSLPSKLLDMALEDNPALTVSMASVAQPSTPAPRTGTTAVDLEPDSPVSIMSSRSSSSSSSTSDTSVPTVDLAAAAATAALELAKAATRAEPTAVDAVAALELSRAAARAATAQKQELD